MTDFLTEYEKLAASIAEEALRDEKAFGDRIDAFKALTPFYLQKMKNGKIIEDDSLPNFDNFASTIHATELPNGEREPGVRDRRRNGN
jgi:hypothetical protein